MDPRLQFQQTLQNALDTYHPGWDVRHHATWEERYREAWEQNRRFNVWVDTLKRWVSGDHFPRLKKFEDFLTSVDFPLDVREELHRQFHQARMQSRRFENTPDSASTHSLMIMGQRPMSLGRPFVGREHELQVLRAMMADPTTRIVTVIGRSGIGKTALVCHVLHEIETDPSVIEDVQGLIYLTAGSDNRILEQLMSLGKPLFAADAPIHEKTQTLQQANRPLFLFLDNLEDIIDNEGNLTDPELSRFVFQALRQPSQLRLLLTSQIELAFPRDLRHLNQVVVVEKGLAEVEGIQLLRDLDPGGTCGLRDAPDELLRQAVQKVHGVPRALEVLVGILEDDRMARLDRVLADFGKWRDAQDMIQTGYRRLDTQAQWVMKALAVYRRPVRAEAIEFLLRPVMQEFLKLDLRDILQRLTRTRMVTIDRASGLISLHPIDADYAYAQLDERGPSNREVLERRAATYYEQMRIAPDFWRGAQDLEPQLAAFEHYLKAGDAEAALQQIGERGFDALLLWGHGQRVIGVRQRVVGKLGDARMEYMNLFGLAKAYQVSGQFQEAVDCFGRAMIMAAAAGDTARVRLSLVGLGDIYRNQGRYTEAVDCYLQALAASDEQDLEAEASALLGLGLIYHQMGDDESALERVRQALNLAEKDPLLQSRCTMMLGYIARNQGYYAEALVQTEQSLHLAELAQDLNGVGNSHSLLGLIHGELGHYNTAEQHLTRAVEIATKSGDLGSQCQRLSRLCSLEIDNGDTIKAHTYGTEALDIATRIGGWAGERLARWQLGRLALATGDPHTAISQLMAAAEVAREIQSNLDLQPIMTHLALAYLALGRLKEALETIETSPAYATTIHRPMGMMTQGLILMKLGDVWGAENALQEAIAAADGLLKSPPIYIRAGYIKATALAGLAVVNENEQANYLQQSQKTLERTLQNYQGAGLVAEMERWLAELQQTIGDADLLAPLWKLLRSVK
ncbi:MAG: tetratricopeptide repeat protein [Chloroflexi bacterium]|nr:tetratricopeptide repeat protein [Chloroflexota bacterium]